MLSLPRRFSLLGAMPLSVDVVVGAVVPAAAVELSGDDVLNGRAPTGKGGTK